MKKIILLLLLYFTNTIVVSSQSFVKESDPNKFSELRRQRDKLKDELPRLEQELNSNKSDPLLYRASYFDSDIKTYQYSIDWVSSRMKFFRSKKGFIGALDSLDRLANDSNYFATYLKTLLADQVKAETQRKKVELLQENYTEKQNALSIVENQINNMMIPELARQNFMKMVSVIFSVMIIALIAGFFWMTKIDSFIRRTIFGGESGIQFITLFSIVIAIILFGITGTLEGKELSALLGGISGYILGRVKFTPPVTTDTTNGNSNGTTV